MRSRIRTSMITGAGCVIALAVYMVGGLAGDKDNRGLGGVVADAHTLFDYGRSLVGQGIGLVGDGVGLADDEGAERHSVSLGATLGANPAATLTANTAANLAATPTTGNWADIAADRARDLSLDTAPRATDMVDTAPRAAEKRIIVRPGDKMFTLLTKNSIPAKEAQAAITALQPLYDLRRLRAGESFTISVSDPAANTDTTTEAAEPMVLLSLRLQTKPAEEILVARDADQNFHAKIVEQLLLQKDNYREGRIRTSLYEAANDADLPLPVAMRLIRMFSFDVDFQREIKKGDTFSLLYDSFDDDLGAPVRYGKIRWAVMELSGKRLEYALHEAADGTTGYYTRAGKSVKKTLMRTPIDGARLSSGYGKRKHPILGYTKMHRGADFAAPTGTPIMAAGDGVIERLGRNGAYGKYIRIRHNGTYKTAYAHLSGYKRGLKRGSRVSQGQIIGYVGSTGRSTGPHLHYEVHRNGKQTNPQSVRLPTGIVLKGATLAAFQKSWVGLEKRITAARTGVKLALE